MEQSFWSWQYPPLHKGSGVKLHLTLRKTFTWRPQNFHPFWWGGITSSTALTWGSSLRGAIHHQRPLKCPQTYFRAFHQELLVIHSVVSDSVTLPRGGTWAFPPGHWTHCPLCFMDQDWDLHLNQQTLKLQQATLVTGSMGGDIFPLPTRILSSSFFLFLVCFPKWYLYTFILLFFCRY